jgi:hypothetical protein
MADTFMKKLLLYCLMSIALYGQSNTITNDGSKAPTWYTNDQIINGKIGSKVFVPGLLGNGWQLNKQNSEYNLAIDNLSIRGTLTASEFIINQYRVTNGNLLVSSSAKVDSAGSNYFVCDNATNHGVSPFIANDIIICQQIDPSGITYNSSGDAVTSKYLIKRLIYRVMSTNGLQVTVGALTGSPTNVGYIEKGDVFVRIGNQTNTARQGMVGIYSDEQYSPYIRVIDSVSSWSDYKSINNIKVQLGRLYLQDPTFGLINGYGLYAQGNIYLKDGSLVFSDSGYIRAHKISYADTSKGWYIGNVSGTPKINIGNSINWLKWTGTGLDISGSLHFTNQSSIAISGFNNDAGYVTHVGARGIRTFYQSIAPTLSDSLHVGDIWFNTSGTSYIMEMCATILPSITWNNVSVFMNGSGLYAGNITAGQITSGQFSIGRIPQSSIRTDSLNNTAGFITAASVPTPRTTYSAIPPTIPAPAIGDFWYYTGRPGKYLLYRCTAITPLDVWSSISVYMDGSGIYADSITAGQITSGLINSHLIVADSIKAGTFTGLTFQTAASGAKIKITGSDHISFWNASNEFIGQLTYNPSDANGLELISIGATIISASDIYLSGASTIYLQDYTRLEGGSDIGYLQQTSFDIYGKLTKVNNISASGHTGYILQSDGTSFTPTATTVFNTAPLVISTVTSNTIDVTGINYVEYYGTGHTLNTMTGGINGQIVTITNHYPAGSNLTCTENVTTDGFGNGSVGNVLIHSYSGSSFIYNSSSTMWLHLK